MNKQDKGLNVKLTSIKGSWKEVLNRARTTVGKEELDKEPSDKFKKKILMSEHSPIRSLIFNFKISNIKSWIATHFVRHHVGVEKWVKSQRTDRTGINRDELKQSELVDMELEANAQALINISRKRLCKQASKETQEVMQEIKWKPISEYNREKYDWVLVKYYDVDYECVPEVAELRSNGKWYNNANREIPFEIRYFFDMQILDKKEYCECCGDELDENNKALNNMCNECKYGIDEEER